MASLARNGTDQAVPFGYVSSTNPTVDFAPATHKMLATAPESVAASGTTAPTIKTTSIGFADFNSYIKNGSNYVVDAAGKEAANNIAAVLVSVKLAGNANASANYTYKVCVKLLQGQNKDHWAIAYKTDAVALNASHTIADAGYTKLDVTADNTLIDVTTTAFAQSKTQDTYYDFLIWANGANIDASSNPGYSAISNLFTISLELQ